MIMSMTRPTSAWNSKVSSFFSVVAGVVEVVSLIWRGEME